MESYDVVVVGAGPAGATAAKCCADHGLSVALIEKETFPRDKPCGGGLPTRVLKRFPYIEPFIDAISYGSVTHSSSLRYQLDFVRDKPLVYTVLRSQFDHQLALLAQSSGATLIQGTPVTALTNHDDYVIVGLNNKKSIKATMVIGCDGMRSMVAEQTQLAHKTPNYCICIMQEEPITAKEMTKYFSKNRKIHLFIKTQGIAGYGWIFPKKTMVNVGFGEFESAVDHAISKPNFNEVYSQYIEMLKTNNFLPPSFPIEPTKGATIPIFPLKTTYTDKILLCGDAAGFINPITGEGIYYAMTSAELAADVAVQAIQNNTTSASFLEHYQHRWKQEFGEDLRLLGKFNSQWGKHSERFVRLLSRDKTFAKLMIGVTGGRISINKYKWVLILRYLYATLLDIAHRKK